MSLTRKLMTGSVLLGSLSLGACKEVVVKEEVNTYKTECQKIANVYYSWSERLIAQDFQGAMSYCVPGSNCEGRTKVHKDTWDRSGQSYDEVSNINVQLIEDDLPYNSSGVLGNTTYYQFVPGEGDVEYKFGFSSSVRKIGGQWKIDGINSNHEPNWWGTVNHGCQN